MGKHRPENNYLFGLFLRSGKLRFWHPWIKITNITNSKTVPQIRKKLISENEALNQRGVFRTLSDINRDFGKNRSAPVAVNYCL